MRLRGGGCCCDIIRCLLCCWLFEVRECWAGRGEGLTVGVRRQFVAAFVGRRSAEREGGVAGAVSCTIAAAQEVGRTMGS